VSLLHTWI